MIYAGFIAFVLADLFLLAMIAHNLGLIAAAAERSAEIDNSDLRACAHELKRIAVAAERSAAIADRKWEP